MRIKGLPAPVPASKADWLAGTTWLGFTPPDNSLAARNQCQSTIQRQYERGYVIEYTTEQFSEPHPGFETDAGYLAEREAHRGLAGRLIAVHNQFIRERQKADSRDARGGRREMERSVLVAGPKKCVLVNVSVAHDHLDRRSRTDRAPNAAVTRGASADTILRRDLACI